MQTDELVYYYRPTPKGATCSDTVAGQPTGFDFDADSVFVIAMLKSAGTVTITFVFVFRCSHLAHVGDVDPARTRL
jgi:hypothetical protein